MYHVYCLSLVEARRIASVATIAAARAIRDAQRHAHRHCGTLLICDDTTRAAYLAEWASIGLRVAA